MNTPMESNPIDQPIFGPEPDALYTLDIVAELTGVSSRTILHYQEQGLISPVAGGGSEAHRFNEEALRALRRIEHLRTHFDMNQAGLRLMLSLLDEVEKLRADLRARRRIGTILIHPGRSGQFERASMDRKVCSEN